MPLDRTPEQLMGEIVRLERRLTEQTRIAAYFSEKQSQFLADVVPQQMWTAAPDGQLDYVNAVVLAYFGRGFAEMIGQGWLDVVHPDDLADAEARWARSVATGEPYEVKFRLRRHDGAYRWHLGRAHAFRPEGEVRSWYGYNMDVGDQMEHTAALERSNSRYRLLSEATHDGMWFWEIADNTVVWNDRLLAMIGVRREDWGGRFEDWVALLHPDERPEVLRALDAHLTRREPYHIEAVRLRQPDGTWRRYSTRGQAEFGPDGRPVRMAGGLVDIEDARRTESSLRFLVRASRILHGSLDWQQTLANVVQAAIPELADWCAVDLLDDDGQIRRLAVAHVDPEKLRIAKEIQRRSSPEPDAPSGVPHVIRSRTPEVHPVITDEMLAAGIADPELLDLFLRLGLRSSMCVPLVIDGRGFGAITLVMAESGRQLTASDLAVAEDLAHRASVAIHNAQLFAANQAQSRAKV